MPIRCVALDLGGVVLQIRHSWADAMVSAGFEPTRDARLEEFAPTAALGANQISFEEYALQLQDYLRLPTVQAAVAVHDAILGEPYPGIHELVLSLKNRGFKVGCLTNTNQRHKEVFMRKFGVMDAFDHVVASCDVGFNKPQPEIYAVFEAVLQSSPESILFFDDNLPNVVGARDVGWEARQIDAHGDTVSQIESFLNLSL